GYNHGGYRRRGVGAVPSSLSLTLCVHVRQPGRGRSLNRENAMSHFVEEIEQERTREERLLKRADCLETRVRVLEEGLKTTQALENQFHVDIDDDGHIFSRMC